MLSKALSALFETDQTWGEDASVAIMQSWYEGVIAATLRGYKTLVSPWLGARCRFLPTCSSYAAAVLIDHGPVKGSILTLRRLCRCHPLGGSGYDPSPPRTAQGLRFQGLRSRGLGVRPRVWKCEA